MEITVELEVEREEEFVMVFAVLEVDGYTPASLCGEIDGCYEESGGVIEILSLYLENDDKTTEEIDEDFLDDEEVKEIKKLGSIRFREMEDEEIISAAC